MIGKRGHGFVDAMKILDGGRISIAALGVGLAQPGNSLPGRGRGLAVVAV